MKTIVVATDMSSRSRPALRFAVQLAEAMNARLHIVHVHYVLRASMWSDRQYNYYQEEAEAGLRKDLNSFVNSTVRSVAKLSKRPGLSVHANADTVSGILEFAHRNAADCICVGTHGAGILGRLIGTNTAGLITAAKIPVLSIPSTYRRKELYSVLYASDMTNCEEELKLVCAFACAAGATLQLLHFYHAYEVAPDKEIIEKTLEKRTGCKVEVYYKPRNPNKSVTADITKLVSEFQPSVLAMFTNQDRDFIDRIISSSITRDYAFMSRVPLLSFPRAKAATALDRPISRTNFKNAQGRSAFSKGASLQQALTEGA